VALLSLALAGCQRDSDRVDAADYDAFWLWAGVKPQPVLDRAKTIYILEGEVRGAEPRLIKLRAATPTVDHADLWLVYRVETLDWRSDIVPQMLADLKRWRTTSNRVTGVQIDFHAATNGLAGFAAFLKSFRARLPTDCQLSITGLLDWSSHGDGKGLNALGATVDEVVLQTYQGETTIMGYEAYLASLNTLHMPFRIGLVQGGQWRAPASLAANRYFSKAMSCSCWTRRANKDRARNIVRTRPPVGNVIHRR
jgi:hypothetical protein